MKNSNDDNSKVHKMITVQLITDHNVSKTSSMSGDDIAEALVKLSHIRLDRLRISKIENLECLGPVTNLYLQQNLIERVENLEALTNLRFLTLASNKIKRIENLKVLKQLKLVDLSFNCIEKCDTDELPPSLMILSLKGNPCTNNDNYRSNITQALSYLRELDEVPVGRLQYEKRGLENSSDEDSPSSDEEFIREGDADFEEGNSLKEFSEDIIDRGKIRSMKQREEHDERMAELKFFRE